MMPRAPRVWWLARKQRARGSARSQPRMKLGLGLGLALLLAATPALADELTEATVASEGTEATAAALQESAPAPTSTSAPSLVARAPAGRFAIGAGYSPDDGFLAHAEVAHDDLFRTGQHLALSAEISALRQRFLLAHEVPDLLGSGLDLRTELFSSRRTYPGFARAETGGAVTLGKRRSRSTRIYARYRIERVDLELAGMDAAAPAARGDAGSLGEELLRMGAADNLGAGRLATLGVGLEHSTLDAPVLPRRGSRLALFAERADRRLGSDFELWRAGGVVEHARPLGPFTLRLHGHATMVHGRDPMGVPLAFRLQHEGNADVRGYPLDTGHLAGDNVEAVGRAELELPLVPKWGISVAGFADAGLRYNTDPAWGPERPLLQRSVGVSLIWRSPIGPLRFDWALPLDGDRRGVRFLFSLGGAP
jgi:outer membrane protein insertion porin family